MSQTKEIQRAELHKTIWRIANDLRGSVDGWDFKSYVLGMLFYRFISENLTAYLNERERKQADPDFDYAASAPTQMPSSVGRRRWRRRASSSSPATCSSMSARRPRTTQTSTRRWSGSSATLRGRRSVPTVRTTSRVCSTTSTSTAPSSAPTVAKRNEKLVKLLDAIGDLNLGASFNDHAIDSFGDAYEYLMTMYASSAGKSGGEFFTPQEVSELLARITVVGKKSVNKVYDPACGSGSLLLKFAKVLGKDKVRQGLLRPGDQPDHVQPWRASTCSCTTSTTRSSTSPTATRCWTRSIGMTNRSRRSSPIRRTRSSWAGDSNPLLINDPRYAPAGVLAPKAKADLAFTMHMLSWLAVNGTAAIVQFPGVLYRGGAEQKIRKYLDRQQLRRCRDSIAAGPFLRYGHRNLHPRAQEVEEGQRRSVHRRIARVRHGRQQEQAHPENQQKILDALAARENVDYFARLIGHDDIKANEYNLSVSSYVDAKDTREAVEITALNAEIARIVARQSGSARADRRNRR